MADHAHLLRIQCGRCGQMWAGADDRAHCASCHHTFDDVELFDAHRDNQGDNHWGNRHGTDDGIHNGAGRSAGRCLAPQALGLAATKNGIWYRPADQQRRTG